MRIVSVQAGKQHLCTVTLDDSTALLIDKTIWEHSGLSVGTEVTAEDIHHLSAVSETHRAREKALYYLSLRDYGSGELIGKLCRAGISRDLAEQSVSRLVDSGLIDDARYALRLARDMQERKLYPKRRIAMALREKGFCAQDIEQAVEQLSDEEEQQALELLRKKRYNDIREPAKREKALAMLARYGFSYTVSKRAIDRLVDQDAE